MLTSPNVAQPVKPDSNPPLRICACADKVRPQKLRMAAKRQPAGWVLIMACGFLDGVNRTVNFLKSSQRSSRSRVRLMLAARTERSVSSGLNAEPAPPVAICTLAPAAVSVT